MADRIAVLTVAFRERRFIGACVRQFEEFGLKHLVLVSALPWNGEWAHDDTIAVAAATSAEAVVGCWTSEASQRNYGMQKLQDEGYDWVLVVDADEFYTPVGVAALLQSVRGPANAVTSPQMSVYWKTEEYRIAPEQRDNPIVALRASQRFTWGRHSKVGQRAQSHARLYHLSYVRDDEEMSAKLASFSHQHEIRPNWYEEVWLQWTPQSRDLHPVVPPQFAETFHDPVPDTIGQLL